MINNRAGAAPLVLIALLLSFDFSQSSLAVRAVGYGAVPLYMIFALVFFIPLVLIMTEIGVDLRRQGGGIYAWMSRYLGARLAFVGLFVWYLSCIIVMGNYVSYVVYDLSFFICGGDPSSLYQFDTWLRGSLTTIVAAMATAIAIKWHSRLSVIITVGAAALIGFILMLLLACLPSFFLANAPAIDAPTVQASYFPFELSSRLDAERKKELSAQLVAQIVFAYCCISAAGGLANSAKNVGNRFKKKLTLAVVAIVAGYAASVLIWNTQPIADRYWVASIFELTKDLGVSWAKVLHLSSDTAAAIGDGLLRISGLLLFLAATAALSILIHAPLRLLMRGVQETSKSTNTAGVSAKAMWVQCLLVLVVMNASREQHHYLIDTLTQVSMALPCILLAVAFYLFKTKPHFESGSIIPKNRLSAFLVSGAVVGAIILSNVSAIMAPGVYMGEFERVEWALYGGAIVVLAGLAAYEIYRRRINKEKTPEA